MKITKMYDVIVAGSGPAGVAAAIKSAEGGAKTLLVECQGSVGGISTTGLMSHFTGDVDSKLYRTILKNAAEKNYFDKTSTTVIDPEMLKITYYEMLEKAGVEILLYTFVNDVIMDSDKITGIITTGKSGTIAYGAKIVIDCTGDGDIAERAGAEYIKGCPDNNGLMQPATLMFKVGGVDMEKAVFPGSFETKVETEKGELQALAKELLPKPAGHVLLYKSTIPGIVTCNMTNITYVDGTKSEDLTRAEIECTKQILPIVKFLREYVPGYEKCYVISSASLIGIRETRHFKGKYTLTEEDILCAREFEDWVVKGAYFNFDVHNLTGSGLDKTGVQHEFKQNKGYTIPYGCLVPEKIKGLLLAGRNISGTHIAHSNYRAMPICMAMGEAAGVASSIAAKKGILPDEVDPKDIQKLL